MSRLLRSYMLRMIKNPALWVCTAIQIFLTFALTLAKKTSQDFSYSLDHDFIAGFSFYGLAIAEILVFLTGSLILGEEYQTNAVRNKLVIGYSRECLYFCNLITVLTASFVMYAARLLFFCIFSLPMLKTFEFRTEYLLAVLVINILSLVMYSSFVTFFMTLTKSTIKTIVICASVYLLFSFLFLTRLINNLFKESDYAAHSIVSVTGYFFDDSWDVPRNARSDFYKFLFDFFPSGQAMQIWRGSPLCLWKILFFLTLQTAGFVSGGAVVSKFKDFR